MERGQPAGRGARGGEDVQALREAAPRLTTGAAALLLAGAVAALPLARGSEDVVAVGARVTIAVELMLLTALVLAWTWLVPLALVALGGLYGAQLAVDDAALDPAAVLVAAGLLAIAELAYWSLEERERAAGTPGDGARRLAFVALLALGSLAVAAAPLVLVDAVRARGLAIDVLGAVAAAAALLAVAMLATRAGRR